MAGIVTSFYAQQQEARRMSDDPSYAAARNAAAKRSAVAMQIRAQLRKAARDPDSLRLTSMRTNADGSVACAEFVGRNALGGMTDDMAVLVGEKLSVGNHQLWNRHCVGTLYNLLPSLR